MTGPGKICLLIIVFMTTPAYTQSRCDYGTAALTLDSGNAVASVTTGGSLFRTADRWNAFFEVPTGSGIHAADIAQVWVGGNIGGEFHFTGSSWDREYFPGPFGDETTDCSELDQVYKITRRDILNWHRSGELSGNIKEWPFRLGAPVVHADEDINEYDVGRGDLPALVGEEAAWWVMNDGGQGYPDQLIPNAGIEARVFAAAMPTRFSTEIYFFRYSLTHIGPDPIKDAYVGIFFEADLGDRGDYSVASDSARNSGFIYRKENYAPGYGENPPVLAVVLIEGPLVDSDGLDNNFDGIIDEPNERLGTTALITSNGQGKDYSTRYYNHLKGLCGKSGKPIRKGYGCYSDAGTPTKYWFSGDPITGTGWLDERTQWIRNFVMPSGPFDWEPGEVQTIAFAVIWARYNDHFDSLEQARSIAEFLRATPEYFAPDISVDVPKDLSPNSIGFDLVYPNPASEVAILRYVVTNRAEVTVELYDVLGRPIRTVLKAAKDPGWYAEPINVSDLPSGVYFYRISIGRLSATKPLTVVH